MTTTEKFYPYLASYIGPDGFEYGIDFSAKSQADAMNHINAMRSSLRYDGEAQLEINVTAAKWFTIGVVSAFAFVALAMMMGRA